MLGKAIGCTTAAIFVSAQLALPAVGAAGTPPAWEPAVDISAPFGEPALPQVVVDAAGNATAAWLRSDGALVPTRIVQSATRPAGGAWQAPVDLSSASVYGSPPAIAVSGDGEILVAWHGPSGIRVAARPSGGAWQPAVDIGIGGSATPPELALDDHGGAIVVSDQIRGPGSNTRYAVRAAERLPDGSWQVSADLSSATSPHSIDVAVDPAGDATVVWAQAYPYDPVVEGVQAVTRRAGEGWQPPVAVSGHTFPGGTVHVVMDPRGRATAVWTQRLRPPLGGVGLIEGVAAAELAPGGAWSSPVALNDHAVEATGSQVAVDAGGRAIAVWRSSASVVGAVRAAGEAWHPIAAAAVAPRGMTGVQLAVAPAGDGVAVWAENGVAPASQIHAAVFARGGAWQPPVALSAPPAEAHDPQIAVGPRGEAVAVWERRDGPGSVVQSATLPAAPPLAAPPPAAPNQPAAPTISGLRLSRTAFRATRSGAAVRATPRSRGSRVSYRVSARARVRFTIARVSAGRRAGGRCAAPSRRNRHATRCERIVAVQGGFTRARKAGADRFTFSGRVGGRTLAAGAYELVATSSGAGRTGSPKLVRFRIAALRR